MASTDIRQATTTDMASVVTDYSVDTETLDTASATKESHWDSPDWSKYLGYFKKIPELKEAIRALARYTVGLGFTTNTATEVILENITGWGEDTFQSILTNMIVVKKVNGDAFAEIIRNDDGTLINLKILDPSTIRIVVNRQGLIIRYEEKLFKFKSRTIKTTDMFHLCNDRIANEIHGTSAIEACQWVIDTRNEAMVDKRRVHHRSTIRVIEVDTDDPTKITHIQEEYEKST